MGKLEILLIIAFFIVILKNTIFYLFWWQRKEYRLDRFLIHLNIQQGRKLLLGKKEVFKWLWLFFASLLLWSKSHAEFISASRFRNGFMIEILKQVQNDMSWLVLTSFLIEAFFYLRQLFKKEWKWPDFTFKAVLIMALVFLFCLGIIFAQGYLLVKLLIFDRLLLLTVSLFVILTNIPAKIYQQFIIQKAKQKIKDHPNLLVIGITGSYGKSSTKEFLAQILASKFKVLKTPANFNTAIGIAKTILQDLHQDQQIFVCEMGAYKVGEIKALCDLVKPKIGIVTGLNEQHQALFGSLENTIQAKFELIEALSKNGLAVFNGYNKYCLEMAKKANKMGRKVKITEKEKNNLKINLVGKHFLENIQMAKIVAEELGIPSEKIARAIEKLEMLSQTMEIIKKKDLVLINSTYNSNPQGVLAALDFLKTFKGQKIFVFQPIIELGKASARVHQKIGKKAGEICDQIVLTNENNYQDLLKGAKGKLTFKKDLSKIQKGVILFEGKGAANYLKSLVTSH
ncbi:hypothetical protein ISS85_01795 [Candidatus Microgenomates bacterium]|nr:hypothetical protein [Candidatus Microgenomates bacterium]